MTSAGGEDGAVAFLLERCLELYFAVAVADVAIGLNLRLAGC